MLRFYGCCNAYKIVMVDLKKKKKLNRSRIVPTPFVHIYIPYCRKLRILEIKVLEINATQINANLMANDFRIKKINAKEVVEFHNKGN